MSDSEGEDNDSNEDTNDDEEEEEEEEDNESNITGKKQELITNDILIIKDIFKYIDQTSKRIIDKFNLEREIQIKTSANQRKEQLSSFDNPDLSWAQYENLEEAQRAELLEKAIMVLAQN